MNVNVHNLHLCVLHARTCGCLALWQRPAKDDKDKVKLLVWWCQVLRDDAGRTAVVLLTPNHFYRGGGGLTPLTWCRGVCVAVRLSPPGMR